MLVLFSLHSGIIWSCLCNFVVVILGICFGILRRFGFDYRKGLWYDVLFALETVGYI